MTVVVGAARLALVVLWVVSAVSKLRDRQGFGEAVKNFGVPSALTGATVAVVPILELACAVMLFLADPFATIGAVGSLVLLAAFTVAIVVNLLRDNRPDCHCFGELGGNGGISWFTVGRNVAIAVLAAFCLIGTGDLRSLPGIFADLSVAARWGAVAGILGAAALVVMGFALWTLMGKYGATLIRLEQLERRAGIAPQPEVAPFTLTDLDGNTESLDGILDRGKPAMLVFISPSCSHCSELIPDLSAWQNDPDHPFSVAVLSPGTPEAIRAKIEGHPLQVLRHDLDLSAYEIQGTPGAIVVTPDGLRATDPAHGPQDIRSVHDALVQQMTGHDHGDAAEPPRPPSHVNEQLPDIEITDADGAPAALRDAVSGDEVLLFWRVDCGFCERITDDVRELQNHVSLRLITTSERADLDATGITADLLRDPTSELNSWLGVPGTPSAVRIKHGVIDSEVAVGGPDVMKLLRESAAAPAVD